MNGHSASPETLDTRHHELLSVDRLTGQKTTTPAPTTGSGDVTGSDVIITSSQHRHGHTHTHRGPQPISPPPPSPQISAADLLLLTEASATHNGTFQCTLCSKQFGYKNGLIRHVRFDEYCHVCLSVLSVTHVLWLNSTSYKGSAMILLDRAMTYCYRLYLQRFGRNFERKVVSACIHQSPPTCAKLPYTGVDSSFR